MVSDSRNRDWNGQAAPATARRNARYGGVLFVCYLAVYGIFVGINTFHPTLMDGVPFAGVNLAIWFGFGLIVSAFGLALLYAWLCRESAAARDSEERAR